MLSNVDALIISFSISEYPMLLETHHLKMDTFTIELNTFVDTILSSVFQASTQSRPIVFSSSRPATHLLPQRRDFPRRRHQNEQHARSSAFYENLGVKRGGYGVYAASSGAEADMVCEGDGLGLRELWEIE
jgi:hypothetical protein